MKIRNTIILMNAESEVEMTPEELRENFSGNFIKTECDITPEQIQGLADGTWKAVPGWQSMENAPRNSTRVQVQVEGLDFPVHAEFENGEWFTIGCGPLLKGKRILKWAPAFLPMLAAAGGGE